VILTFAIGHTTSSRFHPRTAPRSGPDRCFTRMPGDWGTKTRSPTLASCRERLKREERARRSARWRHCGWSGRAVGPTGDGGEHAAATMPGPSAQQPAISRACSRERRLPSGPGICWK
jgi:hypothetical protein